MFPWVRFKLIHSFAGTLPCLLILFLSTKLSSGADQHLGSPDGRIKIDFKLSGSEVPHWNASFNGHLLLRDCTLGMKIAEGGELLTGPKLVGKHTRTVDEKMPVMFGKSAHARNHFRELRLSFVSTNGIKTDVVVRCYNDAIALRYELSGGVGQKVVVLDETTSFAPEGNPNAYVQYLENYKTSHEHEVAVVPLQNIPAGRLLDMPLTLAWPDGTRAAITEASLRNYAGMALARNDSGSGLISKLTPRADGTKVVRSLPMNTPWRVVMLGDRIGALLESEVLYCLNEPSVIADTSWIKPGKITFSWWNGDVFDGSRGEPILSFDMAKKYIDFCASNGIPTHSLTSTEDIVSPWYHQTKPGVEPGPETDVTRTRAGFELQRIKQYADSKNVRLWTWVHQGALRGRVEEAFAAFGKMGWSGMMVDFFDHDDQESVEFAESILEAAARHHILIHLHGVWKPTGLQRTFPNLMNHEGALNLEYLKWSKRCTPDHDLMMVFTRLLAGPMDYHLGGFRAVTESEFTPRNIAPNVLGTRCHQLAMYVCFDNPNPMIADYPMAYAGQPGFDFLQLVPTWWDETLVLKAHIGELVVTARRKGKTWYVGALSARTSHEIDLPLDFLGKGRFTARIWKDSPESETKPNQLQTETLTILATGRFRVRTAPSGGFVAQFTLTPK